MTAKEYIYDIKAGRVPAEQRCHRIMRHLMLERTSKDHLVQTHCSKQGKVEQDAQDIVLSGFQYL